MNVEWLALPLVPLAVASAWGAFTHWRFVRWHRGAGLVPPHLGVLGVVAYHLREMVAFVRIGWWQVRARFADGLRRPVIVTGPPVLFVHGFTQNGTNGWGVRRRLEALGRPTAAVSMGMPFRSIATHSQAVLRGLGDLVREYPDGIDVVCHSMGGVVLRHVLAENPHLARSIRRIVTIGSPHRGTGFASPRHPDRAYDVAEMRIGSPFLASLPDLRALAPHADVTTVAARTDLIVYPAHSCHLDGARTFDLDRIGHAGLLTSRRAQDIVVEALTGAPAR